MERKAPASAALLIVDMQYGLFYGLQRPFAAQRVLANIKRLIVQARSHNVPVLAARHTGPLGSDLEVGRLNWRLLDVLGLDADQDLLFDKTHPSCFFRTDLGARLAQMQVTELVIAGMKTQYSIDTNSRVAAKLGFNPVLVADAHTCMDTPLLSAQNIIAHHNSLLAGPFDRLRRTAEVSFQSPS